LTIKGTLRFTLSYRLPQVLQPSSCWGIDIRGAINPIQSHPPTSYSTPVLPFFCFLVRG
jgi:hypothetical protein